MLPLLLLFLAVGATSAIPVNLSPDAATSANATDPRIGLRFSKLCGTGVTGGLCTCSTAADPGLIDHEYAVVDINGQPDTWEKLQLECITQGIINADSLFYRLAVIENINENNCLATWLSDKYAATGVREFAINLKLAPPPEPSVGTPALTKLYNIWEWGKISEKLPAKAPAFTPPWSWEIGRGGGDCATMIVGNTEQNGLWHRRTCNNELVYGICERSKTA